MAKICAFFGHREIPADLEPRLYAQVEHAIEHDGVMEFWNGCYGEFDALAAKVVMQLRAKHPRVKLVHVLAYPPQYEGVRRGFDRRLYPKELDQYPDHWHIPRRNLWMAAQCDMAIAYVNHAESRIYEPLKWLDGKKLVINLGTYRP